MNDDRALTGIVIDAGHGGADSGAVGNGIVEKDLTLKISEYMFNRLKELGIPVAMTRTTDIELDSKSRPKRALNPFGNGKDVIIISNHINAGGAEGAEVIYALRNTDKLSNMILNNLSKKGQTIRKAYQRRLPSNSSKDYYYMMRETPNTEAVIVEYGFLDNKNDAQKLKTNYKDYADAVIEAILEYKNIKSSAGVIGSNEYIVKQGDTLWTIAKNNNTTVENIKKLNNLTSNTLTIGQKLILNQTDANQYVVKKGDTLYSIANNYGVSINDLKSANGLSTNIISVGQKLIIPSSKNVVYTVKKGDTLYSIARQYNTSINDLKEINNLKSDILSVGQKLLIP